MPDFISSLNLHSTEIKLMPEFLFEKSIITQKTIAWKKITQAWIKLFMLMFLNFTV